MTDDDFMGDPGALAFQGHSRQTTLPLMFGLPNDSMVGLQSISGDGTSMFQVPGASCFLPYLEAPYRDRLSSVFFGPEINLSASPSALGMPLVNNIADPDTSTISLLMLDRLAERLRSPCFNHPRAVLDSGRERVAEKLAPVAGLHVPHTIKLRIDEPDDIIRAIDDRGFRLPIIVRLAGVHGGLTTARIDTLEDIKPALRRIPWGGRDLYLSQFVPYRDGDGLHRKMRLAVVGRQVFLRHFIATEDWHVHSQDRIGSAAAEEAAALEEFATKVLPKINDRVQSIIDALDLDYFGIDCALRPDGRLLVFEANAAMNFLLNDPSPNCWDKPIKCIHDALVGLLFNPDRWRHPTPSVFT